MMFLGSVIVMVHLLEACLADEHTAVVETSSGPVIGYIFKTVIRPNTPCSKPPVAPEPSTRVPYGRISRPECLRVNRYRQNIGAEDCLFLNVFTPTTNLSETPKELKPVMVWLSGSDFNYRESSADYDRPDLLLDRDVLFVSLNYRLGVFGFLSLDEHGVTGNQGLKDQNLALKWVQTNIANFGGDPKKVTIFGDDSGGVSVGFHVLSKASEGLFHGAISMSRTPLAPCSFVSQSEATRRGKELAEMIVGKERCESHLNVLNTVPIKRLLKVIQRAQRKKYSSCPQFVPTIEDPSIATDVFLSENVMDIYESGNFNKVPQILGSMVEDYEKMSLYHPAKETLRLLVDKNGNNPIYAYSLNFPRHYQSASRPPIDIMKIIINDTDYRGFFNFLSPYPHKTDTIILRISRWWTNFAKYGNPTPDRMDEDLGYLQWPAAGRFRPIIQIE